jgi:hypothetical protein
VKEKKKNVMMRRRMAAILRLHMRMRTMIAIMTGRRC